MKKSISTFFFAILALSTFNLLAASKKPFTGKITYAISFESGNIPESSKAMLPKTMMLHIGEDKTKSELFTQMGAQSSIEDLTAQTKIALLDLMGQKFALYQSFEDVQKEMLEAPQLEIENTDETQEIAGYACKKVIAKKTSDGSVFSTAWVADELVVNENINFSNPAFHGIKGVLLKFELDAGNGMMLTFTASEIEKKNIKDSFFEVPEGYKKTTREELESTFGG